MYHGVGSDDGVAPAREASQLGHNHAAQAAFFVCLRAATQLLSTSSHPNKQLTSLSAATCGLSESSIPPFVTTH